MVVVGHAEAFMGFLEADLEHREVCEAAGQS